GHGDGRLLRRFLWRWRMQDRIAEPIVQLLAAAVTRRRWRLRFAFGTVGRAVNAHVEMVVVAPPRPNLVEPRAIVAGFPTKRLFDRSVDEDTLNLGILCGGLEGLAVAPRPYLPLDG